MKPIFVKTKNVKEFMMEYKLAKEEYAIGFRLEDTETVEKVNAVIDKLLADGTLKALGEKYGVNVIE